MVVKAIKEKSGCGKSSKSVNEKKTLARIFWSTHLVIMATRGAKVSNCFAFSS